jgi:ATP-dependent Lon protease
MEIVQLDGCTVQQKLAIAREHLAARQIARSGLDPAEVQVTDDAFLAIIEGYTREAGVRRLERQIGKLLRKVATRVDSGQLAAPTTIGAGDVKQYLGRSRFTSEVAERTDTPGIATGLAVTGIGGDVLFIEAAHMDGDEGLTLTGQLGDVMKESVRIDCPTSVRTLLSLASTRPPSRISISCARTGGRGAEGRPVGGCHHGDCARQSAHRSASPRQTGHD